MQSLYDISKNLKKEAQQKEFRALYLTVDNVRKEFIALLDEINLVQFEIYEECVPDYKVVSTVNELCSYIHLAAKKLEKQAQGSSDLSAASLTNQMVTLADNRPQFPKINLPKFSGEIRQWETFHSLYKSGG